MFAWATVTCGTNADFFTGASGRTEKVAAPTLGEGRGWAARPVDHLRVGAGADDDIDHLSEWPLWTIREHISPA